MAELAYTFKNDALFKMIFVQRPDLLKRFIAELLRITHDSIAQFKITNPEMPAEFIGGKFCRLDINMEVDGQRVDLEIQVNNEGNYPERSLYYWARDYSTAIDVGEDYANLPRTIIISIVGFNLFNCNEYHSDFQVIEVNRHTPLTDKLGLHYFEIPKLPTMENAKNERELWLALFKIKTEEELTKMEAMEVQVMKEAIDAYRHVSTSKEFREIERMRVKARHDEAQALKNMERIVEEREKKKWESVVAEKEGVIANKENALTEKENALAEKNIELAEKDATIAALLAKLDSR